MSSDPWPSILSYTGEFQRKIITSTSIKRLLSHWNSRDLKIESDSSRRTYDVGIAVLWLFNRATIKWGRGSSDVSLSTWVVRVAAQRITILDTCSTFVITRKSALERRSKFHLTMQSDTSAVRMYICEVCDKSFSRKYNLSLHLAGHGQKELQCSHRWNCYSRGEKLKAHTLPHHTQEKVFQKVIGLCILLQDVYAIIQLGTPHCCMHEKICWANQTWHGRHDSWNDTGWETVSSKVGSREGSFDTFTSKWALIRTIIAKWIQRSFEVISTITSPSYGTIWACHIFF